MRPRRSIEELRAELKSLRREVRALRETLDRERPRGNDDSGGEERARRF